MREVLRTAKPGQAQLQASSGPAWTDRRGPASGLPDRAGTSDRAGSAPQVDFSAVPISRPVTPRSGIKGVLPLGRPVPQAQQRVSEPGDPAEIEADRAADGVLAGQMVQVDAAPESGASGPPDDEEQSPLFTAADSQDELAPLPARRSAGGRREVGPSLTGHLAAAAGGGQPIAAADRGAFEAGFGFDFSSVRIHDDVQAARITAAADAIALTYGRDIHFAPGTYAPRSHGGARLLAHELAHVVQQARAPAAVQRKPQPKTATTYYKFTITFDKGTQPDVATFTVLMYSQVFGVSRAAAADLLKRHPGTWPPDFAVAAKDAAAGTMTIQLDSVIYDAVVAELGPGGDQGGKGATQGGAAGAKAAGSKAAAERTAQFGKLPKTEQQKINDEADTEFWDRTKYKPNQTLDPATNAADRQQAELWQKIRDQLLRLRQLLGALPPGVRSVLGDPSSYTPSQYQQLLRIGTKLEAMSAEDLQLYRIAAAGVTTDLNLVETSLDQFISVREKYRQALERNAAAAAAGSAPPGLDAKAAQGTPEVPLQQQLDQAWQGFDKSGFAGMGEAEKTARARDIALQRTATQLKYMASHPGETALGMVKGLNPAEAAKGIEKDISEFKNAESSWGKWASGTGIGGKASGWLAGVAAVAFVVMWFIPGVNLAAAMATALSVAMYAGLASVILSGASAELHIQAAGSAKTEKEFERQTNAAGDELTSFALGVATLAAAFALKFLGRVGFVQRTLRIGSRLNDLKVRAWGAVGVDALSAFRREALAAIQGELAGLDTELVPAKAEHAALREQIDALAPAELMRKIATDPAFASQLGLTPEQAKAFAPAASGPLAEQGAPKAKAAILEGMDDAAAEAQQRIDRFKADIARVVDDLNAAADRTSFDAALDRAQKAVAPEEQARISDEAGQAYRGRNLAAAAEQLQTQATQSRAQADVRAGETETKPAVAPLQEIKVASPDQIAATEPTVGPKTPPETGTEYHWWLFDKASGAKFSEVFVDFDDPAQPGPPDQELTPKTATLPDGTKVALKADFGWTTELLKANRTVWERLFKRPLTNYGGSLAYENLANFQHEFARIRASNPALSAADVGRQAIAQVSFGKARIGIGFGDLSVELEGFDDVTIDQGKYKGEVVKNVPTVVKVKAAPTPSAPQGD